jgi:hypothetical protein
MNKVHNQKIECTSILPTTNRLTHRFSNEVTILYFTTLFDALGV